MSGCATFVGQPFLAISTAPALFSAAMEAATALFRPLQRKAIS